MLWQCVWVRRRLALYVGDDLSPAEKKAIAHHLSHCPRCRRTEEALNRSRHALVAVRECAADADSTRSLWPSLQISLTHLKRSRAGAESSWLPALTLTAAGLALGIVLWNRPDQDQPPVRSSPMLQHVVIPPLDEPPWPPDSIYLMPNDDIDSIDSLARIRRFHLERARPVGFSRNEF